MSSRSESSLAKDEFNFAFMLAHDLPVFATLECIQLTPQQRLNILIISWRLTNRGITNSEDIAEIKSLLGVEKLDRLKRNAGFKAMLETDLVNSRSPE